MDEDLDLARDEKLKKITKELLDTQTLLSDTQSQLSAAVKRAEKSERLYERTLTYNEDLREQIDKLSKQLHLYKTKGKPGIEKSIQTDVSQNNTEGTSIITGSNGDITDDNRQSMTPISSEKTCVSLAESLRETAEAAVENSGFVYDDTTGLYYDYNSGYFYDNENSLYFDPPSGTYFYYDDASQEYQFHSQVDMTDYYINDQSDLSSNHHPRTEQRRKHCSGQADQNNVELKRRSRKRKKRLKADDDGDSCRDSPVQSSQSELDQCMEIDKDGVSELKTHSADLENQQLKLTKEDLHSQQSDNNLNQNSDSEENSSSSCHSNSESELESGELTDESCDSSHDDVCFEDCNHGDTDGNHGDGVSEEAVIDESNPGNYPPCIRVMVTQSDVCRPGTLFIVTYTGGTIGREGSHVICLPELTVSKFHAEIRYLDEEKMYVVVDGGNQNGTFVNGARVSEPRCAGDPHVLKHGDVMVIGSSHLLCHIHQGLHTCDLCEPGQVIANIQTEDTLPKDIVILSKSEKEKLRRKELKTIKKKYGLENIDYSDRERVSQNPSYSDKSEERRQTVGSDNPYQKTEAPASVHRQISTTNKGHQLLQKMGWTEGGGLGKNNHGIQEPVKVSFRLNKSAGLGSVLEQKTDLENVNQSKYTEVWKKTQERFHAVENITPETSRDGTKPAQTQWVSGETLQFDDKSNQPIEDTLIKQTEDTSTHQTEDTSTHQTEDTSNQQTGECTVGEQNQFDQS